MTSAEEVQKLRQTLKSFFRAWATETVDEALVHKLYANGYLPMANPYCTCGERRMQETHARKVTE